jgi:hypothetical protein
MGRSTDALEARDLFVGFISRKLIEASTYVAEDPVFAGFDEAKLRHEIDESRKASTAGGDYATLADSYAKENDALRKRVSEQEHQISTLQSNIEGLAIALRSRDSEQGEEKAEEASPPQSVSEAVDVARRELAGRVAIAQETDSDIQALNPAAGPPEKVLRYLRTLAELSDALASGDPLGRSIPIWLRDRGVECSGDSETAKAQRRPRPVNGEPIDCEFHAKPSEGVSPDLCVRIHFGMADTAPRVRVGYLGRHM